MFWHLFNLHDAVLQQYTGRDSPSFRIGFELQSDTDSDD